jgi:hypothetical protein
MRKEPVPDIPLSPGQEQRLRDLCGFRRSDRALTAADIVAAGRNEDLDTEQPHALLFGDTTGDTT